MKLSKNLNYDREEHFITCLSLTIFEETKMRNTCKELGLYKYTDLSFENIKTIKYIFAKKDSNLRKDLKHIYLLLSENFDIYDVKYLFDSLNSRMWLDLNDFKIDKNIYLDQFNKLNKGFS